MKFLGEIGIQLQTYMQMKSECMNESFINISHDYFWYLIYFPSPLLWHLAYAKENMIVLQI